MDRRDRSAPSIMQLQDTFSQLPRRASRELRVRFTGFEITRSKAGQSAAEVTLEMGGHRQVGKAAGPSSPLGDLRLSAEACLKALMELTGESAFEIVGVKHIRAFDSNLAIVSITHKQDGMSYPLVGCYLAKDDVCRGAAIAVLNATNRLLGIAAQRAEDE
jgi:hypothetical protein